MNVAARLGSAVADRDSELLPTPPPCRSAPPPLPQSVETPPGRSWWVIAGVVSLLLVGAALVAIRARPHPAAPSELAEVAPATVAATAELFASLYFSGSDDTELLYSGDVPDPSGAWINDVTAIRSIPLGNDRWEVTVAVDSLEPVEGIYQPSPLAFFSVVVSESAAYPIVAGPPARVAPPSPPSPLVGATGDVPSAQARVAAAFVVEYLTGGDSSRFSAVSDLAEIATPYVRAEVSVVGADEGGRIEIAARATTSTGALHTLGYLLELDEQGGFWAVTGIGPVGE